jgi:uncharacterized protein (DUF362 family)
VLPRVGRRGVLRAIVGSATLGAVAGIARELYAAELFAGESRWVAAPPAGFVPKEQPGLVVKVEKGTDFAALMQPNLLWPKMEVARAMLERALTELSGEATLVQALGRYIHPADRVAIKVNGISGQTGHTMAVNYEVILPLVEGLIALGVPPAQITVFEQFPEFLKGTRVSVDGYPLPAGVQTGAHNNRDAVMPFVTVFNRQKTRYVRQVTDATALINLTTIKDHHLCGMTGALKNLTHGQIINPHDHHAMGCDPQIPLLYNFPVLRSRVRLHIADAFKLIYDLGPLDREPSRRIPHGAIYASTDPVALDSIGHRILDHARKERGLPSLVASKRDPSYVRTAAELGLGIADLNAIRLREVRL